MRHSLEANSWLLPHALFDLLLHGLRDPLLVSASWLQLIVFPVVPSIDRRTCHFAVQNVKDFLAKFNA